MTDSPAKGIGRGLESLLSQRLKSVNRPHSGEIAIDAIRPGLSQPRTSMRKQQLEELASSIKINGVIQPIIVRQLPGIPAQYEIVAGERRWQAAKLAGLVEIPAVVREFSDRESVAIALIENIQREDLTPAEEARALHRLIAEHSLTHHDVARAVGRSRAAVSNLLRLLDLPGPVMALMESRALGMGHARALLGLESDTERVRVGSLVVERNLSVRQTEALVRKALKPRLPGDAPLDPILTVVSDLLSTPDLLVRLHQSSHGSGRLVIEFQDPQVKDRIVEVVRKMAESGQLTPKSD